ncbi:MAG TPA: GNAT family protein [Solirubrobacteraceae bacterium]|nr:GNAT family protein [Solirubrobacteraceae bacterium]
MELRDDVIVVRSWRAEDADAVYEACQDLDMLQWLPRIPRPYTREDAEAFVSGAIELGGPQFAIEKDGRVVGAIGLEVDDNRTAHAGYWCLRAERGQGIVPRALRLLSRYAFDELDLGRVDLVTDPDNASSQRVAEKVGFTREGVLRSHLLHPDGRRRDSVMFSLLPGELS